LSKKYYLFLLILINILFVLSVYMDKRVYYSRMDLLN